MSEGSPGCGPTHQRVVDGAGTIVDGADAGAAQRKGTSMVQLMDLWLPILVSAVLVFVASSFIWMATPIHKHDYKNPGDKESGLLDAFRRAGLAPGMYNLPWCDHKNMKDPAMQAKLQAGPWALVTVFGQAHNMGKMLGLWFVHLVIVSVFVGYIASHAGLGRGAEYFSVFRIAGTAALMAYAGYALPMTIWHGMPKNQLPGRLIDGVVYSLLTAGAFAGLWPAVVAGA